MNKSGFRCGLAKPPARTATTQLKKLDSLRLTFNHERLHEALASETPGSIYVPSARLVQATGNRVISERLQIGIKSPGTVLQGLTPRSFQAVCGTTEVVPLHKT